MLWFRVKVVAVAFVVLILPCYLLCSVPVFFLLKTMASLEPVGIQIAPDFVYDLFWLLYIPAGLLALRAALAVLVYVERSMFGPEERYYHRRRW
jgi:hypothetical protein